MNSAIYCNYNFLSVPSVPNEHNIFIFLKVHLIFPFLNIGLCLTLNQNAVHQG